MLGFSIAAAVAAGASSALAVPVLLREVPVFTQAPSGPAVVQSYTTSAGSTFEYQSCNSDLAYGNRALPNLLTTTSKTVEACLDACASKGYKLCGVEYHGECWGGNTLHETSKVEDESACNFTCWDNDKEICGGSGASTNAAINLYAVNAASLANVAPTGPFVLQNRTTSAGTYKSQGCYSDLAYGNRALPNMLVTTTKTAEACLDLCAKSNYAYCGVEYHGECWGGNALHDTSKAVKASACDFTCWDNSNQVCGGSGAGTEFNAAMNLYTLDAPAVTTPVQNNQTSTNQTKPVEQPSTGPFVLQNHTASTGLVYDYDACYSDLAYGTRALPNMLVTASKTAEACLELCAQKNYKYCGVEYHGECWGGNTLDATSTKQDEKACGLTCWDNANQICGGQGGSTGAAMNLYTANQESASTATPTGPFVLKNRTTSAGVYNYDACYSDLAEGTRALPNMLVTTTKTAEACLDLCAKSNYTLCGVEYHGECWGGNSLDKTSTKQKESACDLTCWDSPNQVCGGTSGPTGAAMNLYRLQTAQPCSGFLVNGECKESCGAGFYQNNNDRSCTKCTVEGAASCDTSANVASSCSTGFLKDGQCASSCGDGYFQDTTNKVCTKCTAQGAATCTTAPNVASSCAQGVLVDGQCREGCGDGYFFDSANNSCIKCIDPFATTCTTAADVSTSCRIGVLRNGRCSEGCGNGYFQDIANKICVACTDSDAATCPTSPFVATSCKTKYLLNESCVSSCPNDQFAQQSPRECVPVAACSSAQYLDTATNTCNACSTKFSNSVTCSSSAASTCVEGYVLRSGACETIASCSSSSEYLDTASNTCKSCSTQFSNSATCSSSAALTCVDGYVLKAGACEKIASCSTSSQYLDTASNTCKSCSTSFSNSATCSSSAPLTCIDGYVLKAGACEKIASCSSSEYLDTASNTCKSCSTNFSNSATCSSSSPSTCASGYALNNAKTACVALTCVNGQYLDPTANQCLPCSTAWPGSVTCSATQAKTCVSGQVFSKGTCGPSTCPGGYYTAPINFVPGTYLYEFKTYKACVPCLSPWAVRCNPEGRTTACVSGKTCTI